jgi:hypothetical protein
LLAISVALDQVEPNPFEVVATRGLTGTAAVLGRAGAMIDPGVVGIQQAEVVRGKVETTVVPAGAASRLVAARPGRIVVPLAVPADPGRVEPFPAAAAMVLVVVAAGPGMAGAMAAPVAEAAARALVVAYPAGVAPEAAEAIVAGAAARPGRIVVQLAAGPAAAREMAARDPVVAATALVAGAADPRKAVATVDLVELEPLPAAVPVARATVEICRAAALAVHVLAEAAARPGMTKAELVVEIPVAGLVLIEPYLVEEAAVIRFALLEEWVYLVEKAAVAQFAQLEARVFLLFVKRQEEALAPRLNYLEQRDLACR